MNPSTTRGMPLHLTKNEKGDKFGYPSQEYAVLREVESPSKVTIFDNHSKSVTMVSCSPKGDRMITADELGYVYVWHANHPELIVSWEFQGSSGSIHDCSFNEDGEKAAIVGVSNGGKIGKILSLNLKKTNEDLAGHSGRALSCSMKANRPFKLYTGSEDNSINSYGSPGFTLNKSLNHHKGFVNCVRVSPDNNTLVSCSADKSIAILNLSTDEITKLIENAHGGSIYSVAWFEDSSRFATCSADKTIKIWTVSGELISTLNLTAQPKVDDMQMGVIKIKGHLVSVSLSGAINIWNESSLSSAQVPQPDKVIYGHNVSIINPREMLLELDETGLRKSALINQAESVFFG